MRERSQNTEIAFFGGSFTAIDREYMLSLLEAADCFLGTFAGIRISTRPDAIDEEVLQLLRHYGVTSVELGAQSMDNSVLELNERGHTAGQVVAASRLIQDYGFSLGLQMMTGLYGATVDTDISTAEAFLQIRPDTVRIYPTVILKDTKLAQLLSEGAYQPYSQEQTVALCARLLLLFEQSGIPVIRLGLHYSDSLVQNSVGGFYHPAFRELCESKIFYDRFLQQAKSKRVTVTVHPQSVSKFIGQKKCNLQKLADLGYDIQIHVDKQLKKYEIIVG